jgi:octaprenyl-diphosphate synthase
MLVEVADLDIMRIFADATNVISEGEVQQMANAGNPNIDEDTYMQVIYRKTAKLFEAGMECGALLAEADKNAMNLFGMHLGMAFQIADDVLDLQGDVAVIGKNIGDDLNEGKMTLPLIYARDHADPAESQIIQQAIENRSAENFDQILKIVSKTGGIDYSLSRATEHSVLASNALTALPESPYKQVLSKLASFAVSRDV